MKNLYFLLVIFLYTNQAFTQIEGSKYIDFSDTLIANHVYTINHDNGEQILSYLGELTDSKMNTYKVISSVNKFGEKGVNDIVFISSSKEVLIYRCNLPSDLPSKISTNKLYFKNNKSMKLDILRDLFCTPYECFNKIN